MTEHLHRLTDLLHLPLQPRPPTARLGVETTAACPAPPTPPTPAARTGVGRSRANWTARAWPVVVELRCRAWRSSPSARGTVQPSPPPPPPPASPLGSSRKWVVRARQTAAWPAAATRPPPLRGVSPGAAWTWPPPRTLALSSAVHRAQRRNLTPAPVPAPLDTNTRCPPPCATSTISPGLCGQREVPPAGRPGAVWAPQDLQDPLDLLWIQSRGIEAATTGHKLQILNLWVNDRRVSWRTAREPEWRPLVDTQIPLTSAAPKPS